MGIHTETNPVAHTHKHLSDQHRNQHMHHPYQQQRMTREKKQRLNSPTNSPITETDSDEDGHQLTHTEKLSHKHKATHLQKIWSKSHIRLKVAHTLKCR